MQHPALRVSFLGSILLVPAWADIVTFNSPAGNLGTTTSDFTLGTATIHAAGLNGGNLYVKNDGSDEVGLGLANDPSGDNKIWVKSGGTQDFIQLDLLDLINKGYTNIKFQMDSSTAGEGWSVRACSVAGVDSNLDCSSAVTGSNEGADHSIPAIDSTYHYLDFSATSFGGSNVLLHQLSAQAPAGAPPPIPEPSSILLLASVLAAVGMSVRRRSWRS